MISTETITAKLRALWIAASFISSIWFLYWICYDVFVWNKVLTQVRPQNYFGLVFSIALIILGIKLEKIGISEKLVPLTEKIVQKKRTNTRQIQQIQQVPEEEQLQPIEQAQQIQPIKEEKNHIPTDSSIIPGCRFHPGYLQMRPKSVEIPEECLECGYVVECLSPTPRTIEKPLRNP